jgi:Domain of unknown function (DUF4282)
MSNRGYGRNPADYGPLPGQEVGYDQAAYPGQGASYAGQDAGYGQGQDSGYAQGQDAGYGQAGYTTRGAGYPTQGTDYAEPAATTQSRTSHAGATGAKGFVGSLFDFGFNSFVTPKVVKVLYVLIMAGLALAEIGYLLFAFRESTIFGIISLVILCPLTFLVYLALWRILLELFIVIFRISDDLRSIRERGESR